jgi:hypothetical protein
MSITERLPLRKRFYELERENILVNIKEFIAWHRTGKIKLKDVNDLKQLELKHELANNHENHFHKNEHNPTLGIDRVQRDQGRQR